jgi:hypothetical protein
MRQNVNPQQTLDFLNLIYCLSNRPIEFDDLNIRTFSWGSYRKHRISDSFLRHSIICLNPGFKQILPTALLNMQSTQLCTCEST